MFDEELLPIKTPSMIESQRTDFWGTLSARIGQRWVDGAVAVYLRHQPPTLEYDAKLDIKYCNPVVLK